jgi:hypothetical protein
MPQAEPVATPQGERQPIERYIPNPLDEEFPNEVFEQGVSQQNAPTPSQQPQGQLMSREQVLQQAEQILAQTSTDSYDYQILQSQTVFVKANSDYQPCQQNLDAILNYLGTHDNLDPLNPAHLQIAWDALKRAAGQTSTPASTGLSDRMSMRHDQVATNWAGDEASLAAKLDSMDIDSARELMQSLLAGQRITGDAALQARIAQNRRYGR